jgi:uncharacterized repeat protein (TIGR03803 family)
LLYYDHRFFGTTQYGGTGGNGTIFELRSTGVTRTLYSFGKSPDGAEPVASLVELKGALYGTTEYGGANRTGSVFSISPDGKYSELYSFGSGGDGANPAASLTALGGALYGTTMNGGKYGEGTVYKVTLSNTGGAMETVLHSFGFGSDGAYPASGMIPLHNVLYGTTSGGGGPKSESHGTVFRVRPDGSEAVLYPFDCVHGSAPLAAVVVMNATLYGTTSQGGEACSAGSGDGTVFALSSGTEEHVVHPFAGGTADGDDPVAALIGWRGKLYGTTYTGGVYGGGTVFSVTPGGDEVPLHPFGNGTDGNHPAGAVVHVGKAFYGTTSGGGLYGGGIVYKLTF